jgi:ElaB/YqjD/DUF883 family membrane-anchored ribosome-binding protein
VAEFARHGCGSIGAGGWGIKTDSESVIYLLSSSSDRFAKHPAQIRESFFPRLPDEIAFSRTQQEQIIMNDTSPLSDLGFGSHASQDPFQAAKTTALKAAEELRAAASQKASELRDVAGARAQHFKNSAEQKAAELKSGFQDKAGDIRGYADDALGQAKERYEALMSEAEVMAREKPRQALLTAFGVGLFVGLLLRR